MAVEIISTKTEIETTIKECHKVNNNKDEITSSEVAEEEIIENKKKSLKKYLNYWNKNKINKKYVKKLKLKDQTALDRDMAFYWKDKKDLKDIEEELKCLL